jgi:hypothetical protein
MVELETDDFSEIIDWFTLSFGKYDEKNITQQAKKTFWKLSFLLEDKLKEMEDMKDDD